MILYLQPEYSESFAYLLYLKCFSLLEVPFGNHADSPLIWTFDSSNRQCFSEIVSSSSPELDDCLTADYTMLSLSDDTSKQLVLSALDAIERAYLYSWHKSVVKLDEPVVANAGLSLRYLTETIVMILHVMLASDIDDNVCPSITGLANLYIWQTDIEIVPKTLPERFYDTIVTYSHPILGIELVFYMLAGLSLLGTPARVTVLSVVKSLAKAGNGL